MTWRAALGARQVARVLVQIVPVAVVAHVALPLFTPVSG